MRRLVKTLGKSKTTLEAEALAAEKKDNPANFGRKCARYCLEKSRPNSTDITLITAKLVQTE